MVVSGVVTEGVNLSQNCFIDVKATKECAVLCLHIVREHFHGEVAHAHLSVKVLELALDHDVERLEQQRVEIRLDLLFALVFLKLFEFLGLHACLSKRRKNELGEISLSVGVLTHEGRAVFSGEVNIDTLSEVRNLGGDHVGWQISEELLTAVLTSEAS